MTVHKQALDVLLTTEATYPVVRGGVSTWCHALVHGIRGVNYYIYTVLAHPHLPNRFELPLGVKLFRVPLWGTEEPTEHLDMPFSLIYDRKLRTSERVLRQEFLPLFDQMMSSLWDPNPPGKTFGALLYQWHRFFDQYDYQEALKSQLIWDFFLDGLRRERWIRHPTPMTLLEALQTLGWLYRFFVVLCTPVPRVDVVHSSAAAFCGLPGVLAKCERKTPMLLTEHGVYLREQYLSIGRANLSPFSRSFLLGLVRCVTAANYAFADIVAPVAAFNARWETRLGVPPERIRIIYNGVDPTAFAPRAQTSGGRPTVVSVARIDPLKDILTLIRSAAVVKQQIPDVRFIVYGSISVPAYYRKCLELRSELGLEENFIFAGHTSSTPTAYASGDVVALSSLSEGFPYAVVEAMMSGKAVVATDVGGTREACGNAALLVPPQNPEEMGTTIIRLLRDPGLRAALAKEARERALNFFTIQRQLQLYAQTYADLEKVADKARGLPASLPSLVARRRWLALERAQALAATSRYQEAVHEYRLAVDLDPESPAVPLLLLRIADLHLLQLNVKQAWREMERAEALAAALRLKEAG